MKIERVTQYDFEKEVGDIQREPIPGNRVHETIGPIWVWTARYINYLPENHSCPWFWNVYEDNRGNILATKWEETEYMNYKEVRRVVYHGKDPKKEPAS